MPSGFQQDQNQLTPTYYRVVISCGDNSAFWFATNDNDGDETAGRISPYSWDACSSLPTTLAISQALARGNLRFQAIVEAVENLADCQILDIETNATDSADNQADNSQVAFTIKYDRDEGVFPAYAAIRKSEGANSSGTTSYDNVTYPAYWSYTGDEVTISNTEDALRDVIWKTLAQGRTRSVRVFHPLEGSDPLTGAGYQETITAAKPFNNDYNAFNDITVTEINGTTTTITPD